MRDLLVHIAQGLSGYSGDNGWDILRAEYHESDCSWNMSLAKKKSGKNDAETSLNAGNELKDIADRMTFIKGSVSMRIIYALATIKPNGEVVWEVVAVDNEHYGQFLNARVAEIEKNSKKAE